MRPGPPAGRGGWGRGRRQEERGRESGGGDSSKGRILRPWEAAARGSERSRPRQGAGRRRLRRRRRRKGPERGRASAAEATERGRAGGWLRARAGAAATAIAASESQAAGGSGGHGGPCPCAPAATGRGPARWSRSTCAPRSQPAARPGRNRWVPRPHPPLLLVLAPSLPPPPGPGSVQEAVRDEVPSCFPAGAALPPAPGLLLARRPERLCPVGWSSSPRGLWRRSFEDRFRASSASQLCTSFPSVERRLGGEEAAGPRGQRVAPGGDGTHLLTAPWQSPGARRFPRTAAWGGE